jgi:hypothetical protein
MSGVREDLADRGERFTAVTPSFEAVSENLHVAGKTFLDAGQSFTAVSPSFEATGKHLDAVGNSFIRAGETFTDAGHIFIERGTESNGTSPEAEEGGAELEAHDRACRSAEKHE